MIPVTSVDKVQSLILVLFFLFYSSISLVFFQNKFPISPDDSQVYFFSKQLAEKLSIVYYNPLNAAFTDKIFTPRQYVQVNDKTAPDAFVGYLIVAGILRSVNDTLFFIVNPIFAVISLIYINKITKHIFNTRVAVISTMILGFYPAFVYWSVSYFNNVAELAFLLAGIYYLFTAITNRSPSYYILCASFFGLSVWIRYTNILLIPVFISFYFLKHIRQINMVYAFLALIVFGLILGPLLYVNNSLFGSPFTIGQTSQDQMIYKFNLAVPDEKIPFVPFRSVGIMIENTINYVLFFFPLLSALTIISLFLIYRSKSLDYHTEIYALLIIILLWSIYYLGGVYHGYNYSQAVLNSSYTRYLLIVYAIFSIFVSNFLLRLNKILLITLVCILMITFINYTFNSSYGLSALNKQMNYYTDWNKLLVLNTPPNSVIFTKGADKIIFPNRNVALYQMLTEKESYTGEGVVKTVRLMSQLLDNGYEVYFINEDNVNFGDKARVGLPSHIYLGELQRQSMKFDKFIEELSMHSVVRE